MAIYQFCIILILLLTVHSTIPSDNMLCDPSLEWKRKPSNNLFTFDHSLCTATITAGTTKKQANATVSIDVANIFSDPDNYPIEFIISGNLIGTPVMFGMVIYHINQPEVHANTYVKNLNDEAPVTLTFVWGSIQSDELVETCNRAHEVCGDLNYPSGIVAGNVGRIGLVVWNLTNASTHSVGVTFTYASLTGLTPNTNTHSEETQIDWTNYKLEIACIVLVILALIGIVIIVIMWFRTRKKLGEQLALIQTIHNRYDGNDNNGDNN